jgi:hypothetical protein
MKRVFVLFIVGVALFGVCSAQDANAQNIGQRIIGTWASETGVTWVFNANGNLTISGMGELGMYLPSPDGQYKFGVTDTHLALLPTNVTTTSLTRYTVYSISISSDGRTLIVDFTSGIGIWFTKR